MRAELPGQDVAQAARSFCLRQQAACNCALASHLGRRQGEPSSAPVDILATLVGVAGRRARCLSALGPSPAHGAPAWPPGRPAGRLRNRLARRVVQTFGAKQLAAIIQAHSSPADIPAPTSPELKCHRAAPRQPGPAGCLIGHNSHRLRETFPICQTQVGRRPPGRSRALHNRPEQSDRRPQMAGRGFFRVIECNCAAPPDLARGNVLICPLRRASAGANFSPGRPRAAATNRAACKKCAGPQGME